MMAHAVIQALAVVSFAAWASLSTLVILRVIDTILPLRAGHKHCLLPSQMRKYIAVLET